MSKADALRLPEYLRHILGAIERIHLCVEDTDELAFLNDIKPRMPSSAISRSSVKLRATSSVTTSSSPKNMITCL